MASKWHRKLPKFYLPCCQSPWCCMSVPAMCCALVYAQKKTWEIENEIRVFASLNLLVCGLATQKRKSQTETAVGHRCWLKYARIIAQFKITPNLKEHWAPRIFSLPFVYSLQISVPPDKMQTKQFRHTGHSSLLGAQTLSLPAFLCASFHFGDCIRRARFVTSTIARALVEKNKIKRWLKLPAFPRKGHSNSNGRLWPGRNGAMTSEQACFNIECWALLPETLIHFGQSPRICISNKFPRMLIHFNMEDSTVLTIRQEAAYLSSSERTTWETEGSAVLSLTSSIARCWQSRATETIVHIEMANQASSEMDRFKVFRQLLLWKVQENLRFSKMPLFRAVVKHIGSKLGIFRHRLLHLFILFID